MDATSTALRTEVIDDAVRFANMHEEWGRAAALERVRLPSS
jgi:hypothetical protein